MLVGCFFFVEELVDVFKSLCSAIAVSMAANTDEFLSISRVDQV